MSSAVAHHECKSALRYIVALNLVVNDHLADFGQEVEVTTNDLLDHAFVGVVVGVGVVSGAAACDPDQGQVAGSADFKEACLNCFVDCLGDTACNKAAQCDGCVILNHFCCLCGSYNVDFFHGIKPPLYILI